MTKQLKRPRRELTEGVVKVFLSHQLQILLNGFGGQRVLPEDQHIVVCTAVHLRHHQVCQEVLSRRKRSWISGPQQ